MFDRSYVKNILPTRLQNYMTQAEADLKVTEVNLKDKTLLRSSIGAKWCRYSFEEERYKKKIQKDIDDLRETIKKKLFEQKKNAITNGSANVDKLLEVQAEKLMITTDEYKKLQAELKEQEDIIRLIMEIQKLVSQFSFDINNINSTLKLQQC